MKLQNRLQKEVTDFYNEVGWQKQADGLFKDASLFEDLREVSKIYVHKCHLRLNKYIKNEGKFILDVASGPIQYPEYLTYSHNFEFRVCVDISLTALKEARETLGLKGKYVLADITELPFKSNCIDIAISLHTIYHVPADKQLKAFTEIYRVMKPDARAVIVYSWDRDSLLMNIFLFPFNLLNILMKKINNLIGLNKKKDNLKLYFQAHNNDWLEKNIKPKFDYKIFVWRSLSVAFMRIFIHKWLFGKKILSSIYWLEDRYPQFFGKFGQYPLIIIDKKPG